MASISNPNNIKGMARLLASEDDDNTEKTIEEIEKSITNGGNIKGADGETDYASSFIKGIKKGGPIAKPIALPNGNSAKINGFHEQPKKEQKISMPLDKGLIGSDDESDDYDKLLNKSGSNGLHPVHSGSDQNHFESQDDDADDEIKTSSRPTGTVGGKEMNGFNQFNSMNGFSYANMPLPSAPPMPQMAPPSFGMDSFREVRPQFNQFSAGPKFSDPMMTRMTEEQKKQNRFREVMSSMEPAPADDEVFNQEDEEEEMAHMVEQIDTLKTNLTEAGIDISNIQEVTVETPKREAQKILRVLQIKNDRLRYCDIFEETILAAAYALEKFFDGEREVFGKRIDMNGYSDTVRVKLKRMRYDTGTFVSGVMKGYNVSSGWRIALEILPTLFTYTRDRSRRNKDNLGNSQEFRKALQDLYPEKNTK